MFILSCLSIIYFSFFLIFSIVKLADVVMGYGTLSGFVSMVIFILIPLAVGSFATYLTPNVEVYVEKKLIYKGNAKHVTIESAGNSTKITIDRVGFFSYGVFYNAVSNDVVVKTTNDKNKWIWLGDDERG